jgi:alkylation response protein AidB-like acyl-CoA dehydrogenase
MSTVAHNNFASYIENFKARIALIFSDPDNEYQLYLNRGLPPHLLHQVLKEGPLKVFIPEAYGGGGGKIHEMLTVLETASYQSLPLSLLLGINGGLFLQPIANYAREEAKKSIFKQFIEQNKLGGLMITEPDYGSDALKMQTSFIKTDNQYRISGTKHWAGLTGLADFWLITAREMNETGELKRDIGFFIHDTNNGGIEVEEYYNSLGLYMIPYGLNRVNITVPEGYRLQPKTTGISMMLDLLHRSRLLFPGMATGFLHRLLDEAITHCKARFVGGKSLFNYDQVKERLSRLQSYFTSSSAMSGYIAGNIPIGGDISRFEVLANSVKSVITDYMQEAAQSFLQLVGAKGYRLDHLAGRAVVDSRPFQIFEGSNDILYQQVTESVLKKMRNMQISNLHEFLKHYPHTDKALDYIKDIFNFEVDFKMSQRNSVQLGKVIGRLIVMNLTIDIGLRGFNSDMIMNSLKVLQNEIQTIFTSFKLELAPEVVDDYQDGSRWLNTLSPAIFS